jgi:hypothetical protein
MGVLHVERVSGPSARCLPWCFTAPHLHLHHDRAKAKEAIFQNAMNRKGTTTVSKNVRVLYLL